MLQAAEATSLRILIVDDDESIGRLLSRTLSREGYTCTAVRSAREALEELSRAEYALVISDIKMPETSGVQLLESILKRDKEIAVIMLTGAPELNTAVDCLKLGAYDYLTKPVGGQELLISVSRALERRRFLLREKQYQEDLEREVKKKTRELEETRKEVIHRLALAAEYRDEDTRGHLLRIAGSSLILAQRLGLPGRFCEMVHAASPLHDIGKIGIPDSILLKPGPLSRDEYEIMKTHPEIGRRILQNSGSELIRVARDIAAAHHEKYDGRGYPRGMKGEEIPMAARIVAVADVFDALTSKRPYKEPWSVERSVDTIMKERGKHFDPAVVDAFLLDVDEIAGLRQSFGASSHGEGKPPSGNKSGRE